MKGAVVKIVIEYLTGIIPTITRICFIINEADIN